jgi:hypothetical protein
MATNKIYTIKYEKIKLNEMDLKLLNRHLKMIVVFNKK